MTIFEQPGTWLKLNTDEMAGFWVQEGHPFAVMKCLFQDTLFSPPRKIVLRQGLRENFPLPWTFYKHRRRDGFVESSMTRTFSQDTEFQFDATATINSLPHVRIFGGDLDDYWVPVTARAVLDCALTRSIRQAPPKGDSTDTS